jgi:hypothetical protein
VQVENVTELSVTAARKLERVAKKAQPVAQRPKRASTLVAGGAGLTGERR